MKKMIVILFSLLVSFCKIYAQIQQNTTQESAWNIVRSEILKNDTGSVNVFVSKSIVFSDTRIKTMYRDEKSPWFDSWFFFIDDAPFASWTHSCRYVFVNIKDGSYAVFDKQDPPILDQMIPLVEKRINAQGILFDFKRLKSSDSFRAKVYPAPHDYAVIISGGVDSWNNWVRYWNDCAAIYSTLINVYGYARDHIYVLISDGTDPGKDRHHYDGHYDSSPLDLDGDGINDIQYAATRTNISRVFNILASRLTPSDHLFIYTTDHGGQESGMDVYMNLWNNETMRDDEFAREVNKVNAGKVNICMEQCRSGGFIDDLRADNRVIATACRHDENSQATHDLIYDEFVYHWTAAVSGRTPTGDHVNADRNGDGIISMEEAFQYAQANDSRPEHPQYSSTPVKLWAQLYLKKFPSISGSTVVCNQETYTIQDLPSGASVQWSTSNGNLQLVSGQGMRTAVFRKNGTGECTIRATLRSTTLNITPTLELWAGPVKTLVRAVGKDSDSQFDSSTSLNIDLLGGLGLNNTVEFAAMRGSHHVIDVTWELKNETPDVISLGGHGPLVTVSPIKTGVGHFRMTAIDKNCGRGTTAYVDVRISSKYHISLSPNPATDVVTLKLTEPDDGILSPQGQGSTTRGVTSTYEIQLWNGLTMLRSFKTNQLTFQIPIAGLPTGLYFVRVIKDGQTYTEKLIKN